VAVATAALVVLVMLGVLQVMAVEVGAGVHPQALVVVVVLALVEKLLHLTEKVLHGSAATQQESTGVFHERHNNHQRAFS
jgi:hypothetical protein